MRSGVYGHFCTGPQFDTALALSLQKGCGLFLVACLSFLFHQKHSLMKAFGFANKHHVANAVFTSSSANSPQSMRAEITF